MATTPTPEQQVVAELKTLIGDLSPAAQRTVFELADLMRLNIKRHPVEGRIALTLIGAELAAESEPSDA